MNMGMDKLSYLRDILLEIANNRDWGYKDSATIYVHKPLGCIVIDVYEIKLVNELVSLGYKEKQIIDWMKEVILKTITITYFKGITISFDDNRGKLVRTIDKFTI